ncbi:hypothetical protein [Variovorax sp. V15]|uniref:hypothetical protein n=1 Tax=Variovorax sp. V15 TaxID=3065952 RepID=UPI0034E86A5D
MKLGLQPFSDLAHRCPLATRGDLCAEHQLVLKHCRVAPDSAGLLLAALTLLLIVLLPSIRSKREEAFVEEGG